MKEKKKTNNKGSFQVAHFINGYTIYLAYVVY